MTPDLLERPEMCERVARYSVEVYVRMPKHNGNGRGTELLRGIVFEKMPKSSLHQLLAEQIRDLLYSAVASGFCVEADSPLVLRDSVREPDVAVVRGSRRGYALCHPQTAELVVEVAVTLVREDCERAAMAAEAGVNEYWDVAEIFTA